MILVDFNQIVIANLVKAINPKDPEIDENLVRHMVLNSLRLHRRKFTDEYGELVICCDDKNNWRKDVFPLYKANRKKDRGESSLDWPAIFTILDQIKQELRENFPYKVVQIERAEADDVIASLCHEFGYLGIAPESADQILILSSDKDFGQLQKYANVSQYSPVGKKFIRVTNPAQFLNEHIIKGDRGDGIPNFLSDDDVFVAGKRSKPIRHAKLTEWSIQDPKEYCSEAMMRGWQRNKVLIDLDLIPQNIRDEVINEYEGQTPERNKLFNYFVKKQLKNLMEHIGDF
jgi:hypothetical protein